MIGRFADKKVAFLPRHGVRHSIPPHKVNYRANIWGFKKLGVEKILSIGATGGIRKSMKPGSLVISDQIIDITGGRKSTFFDEGDEVFHIDLTEPYCSDLRKVMFKAASRTGVSVKKRGTYICTNGPRLETKAEISFFSRIGADIVGMTAMPEAALAREAEVCYAGIAVVTNYAAGITEKTLTAKEVIEVMEKTLKNLKKLLREICRLTPQEKSCDCMNALEGAKV
jgi:5'-methylthioadenosine phosphorylase